MARLCQQHRGMLVIANPISAKIFHKNNHHHHLPISLHHNISHLTQHSSVTITKPSREDISMRMKHQRHLLFKATVFLSSTSLTWTLSPQLRPASLSPILLQAAFSSSSSSSSSSCKFEFGARKTCIMTPIPVTPAENYSNGACLRRSTRLNRPPTIPRTGVRLFQKRSADSPPEKDDSSVPKRKRTSKRSSSNSSTEEPSTPAFSRRVRGSKPNPVTPEPVLAENDDNSTPPKKKAKTKTKPKAKTKTKTKSSPKKKASKAVVSWPEPDGWLETYELVRELRKDKTAPCDFMGAEALSIPPQDTTMDDKEYAKISRFHTLIALMLSSQTKDAMVGQAMENLRDTSDGSGGLTVESILAMDPKVLNTKIYSVGFRNNKTKYIKQAAQILQDDYNGDVPPTAAEMIRDLPGVGPKMAYIVENICWNKQSGIGVDTHMQRLFPKLGWVSPDTKNPEQTRKQLESWLPQDYWGEVNLLWVGFGQEVQQERQKVLKKALVCSRPLDALTLLRRVDFDLSGEWNKLQSVDEEIKNDLWTNDDEREKFNAMIDEAMSKR